MLKEVLESIIKKGAYKACIGYLIEAGMSEFTANLLISELLDSAKK